MGAAKVPLGRPVWSVLGACAVLALAGCGGLKLVPVSGKVTLDGKPLKGGGVSFVPDASKGNNAKGFSCTGRINGQGRYELGTSAVKGSDSGKGAPLGWYKVTLVTTLPGSPEITVNPKYLDAATTPLAVEVVADPKEGAYDLQLTK
jgi:hypothetical protein